MAGFSVVKGPERQVLDGPAGRPIERRWGRAAGTAGPADGLAGSADVAWSAGFEMIAPADPADRRGVVVEVENRGRPLCFGQLHDVAFADRPPDTPLAPQLGNGCLFERGLAYARIQWQFGFADLPADGQGAAFAILREFGQALVGGSLAPDLPPFARAYLTGTSQGGRFVKTFVHEGFNADPDDPRRPVFAGLLGLVGGAGYLPINRMAAERGIPAEADNPHGGDFPPYTWDAVLSRPASDPRLIEVFTTTEYYNRRGSLVTGDPATFPANVRHYDLAGANHLAVASYVGGFPAIWPRITEDRIWAPVEAGGWNCNGGRRMPVNQIDIRPYLRAALVNLDRWVAEGVEPPPTAIHPLRPAEDHELANPLPGVDLRVPAVDDLGNPVGGVRVADVAAPLGSFTPPWFTGADRGTRMFGGFRPLPPDTIRGRYPSRAAYLAAYGAAVDRLIADRYLIAADRARLLARAGDDHDRWSGA